MVIDPVTDLVLRLSAATIVGCIWLAACLGSACGAGAWAVTSVAFGLLLVILLLGAPVERWVIRKLQPASDDQEKTKQT